MGKMGKNVSFHYIYGIFVGRRTSYTSNSPTSTLVPFETKQGLKGIHQIRGNHLDGEERADCFA